MVKRKFDKNQTKLGIKTLDWNVPKDHISRFVVDFIDLDHYMELNNLSASEGFKIYKTKQKILKIRRKIKNEIFAYQQILAPLKQYTNGHVERSIAGLKTQEYSPRIMNKLFNRENNL